MENRGRFEYFTRSLSLSICIQKTGAGKKGKQWAIEHVEHMHNVHVSIYSTLRDTSQYRD